MGAYEVAAVLGEGGMGEVYRARAREAAARALKVATGQWSVASPSAMPVLNGPRHLGHAAFGAPGAAMLAAHAAE